MPSWRIKAFGQKALAAQPALDLWNGIWQRLWTHSVDFRPEAFAWKVQTVRRHMDHLRAFGPRTERWTALEIGTGWYPVVPIGLWLCGAERIYACDLRCLLEAARIRLVVQAFAEAAARKDLEMMLPLRIKERVTDLTSIAQCSDRLSLSELLRRFRINVVSGPHWPERVPSLEVDLFVSNETLEHISENGLSAILRQVRAFASSGGVISHFINMQDHYAAFDPRITPYHFFRFSGSRWRLYNNALHFQNRLRLSDYLRLHDSAGWEIVRVDPAAGDPAALNRVPIHPEFRRYPADDLLIPIAWVVGVNRRGPS